jgi:IclR family pca regulon transcriptional regulator
MTLSDIAKVSNLSRATARRILLTLQRAGFVAGDERLFSLTPRVLALASAYLSSNQIVAVMQPLMDDISTKARKSARSPFSMAMKPSLSQEPVPHGYSPPASTLATGFRLIAHRSAAYCSAACPMTT